MAFHNFSYTEFISTPFLLILSLLRWNDSAAEFLRQVIISNHGGSEPLWSYMKCSGVEKQCEENAVGTLSHCSFSLSLSLSLKVFSFLSSILRVWYFSCAGRKEAGDGQDQHTAIGVYSTSFLEEDIFYK